MAAAADEETLRFLELIHGRHINAISETATKHRHVTTFPALFFCSDTCHLTLKKKKKEICFLPLIMMNQPTHLQGSSRWKRTNVHLFCLPIFFGKSVAMCVTFSLNTNVNHGRMKRGTVFFCFFFAAGAQVSLTPNKKALWEVLT